MCFKEVNLSCHFFKKENLEQKSDVRRGWESGSLEGWESGSLEGWESGSLGGWANGRRGRRF